MKNKLKLPDQIRFGYSVRINSHCYEHEQSPEQWGSWHEAYNNHFGKVIKDDKYGDVVSKHDFKVGDQVFIVWAEWSTGDSFGNGENSQTEAFGIFKEGTDAFALAHALKNASTTKNKNGEHNYDFTWKSSEGEVIKIGFVPWFGYFETLGEVHVEATQIKEMEYD